MMRHSTVALLGLLLAVALTLQGCGGGGGGGGGGGPPSCPGKGAIIPCVLRDFYNMPAIAAADSQEAANDEKATQAVYASLQQHWSPADRLTFQKQFGLPDRNVTELDSNTNKMASDQVCIDTPGACGEANLDVQYMLAQAPWSRMGFFYVDGNFVDFLEQLENLDTPPEAISISYGLPECGATPEHVAAFNNIARKLGAQGVTIIASSGDDGAQSTIARPQDGVQPTCQQVLAECDDKLQPNWPASSPYVTGVGATMGVESNAPEVTCQISCDPPLASGEDQCVQATGQDTGAMITSGGGYSSASVPSYQSGHVTGSGRGVPDVSLAGHAYALYIGGNLVGEDGTSASAPAFAGMVSQVNAARKAKGQTTVGFINPAMYAAPSAFNDITVGDNKCGTCADGSCICCGGYDAVTGWDAATGLGSVDFAKFAQIFPDSTPTTPSLRSTPTKETSATDAGGVLSDAVSVRHSSKFSNVTSFMHRLGWSKPHRADPDALHDVLFAVKQKNMDHVEEVLMDRSDPKSANYGKWLSGKEVREMTRNDAALEAVHKFLKDSGLQIVRTTLSGAFVRARASMQVWEKMLDSKLYVYEAHERKATHVMADAYSVPAGVAAHVDGLLGVGDFPVESLKRKEIKLRKATEEVVV